MTRLSTRRSARLLAGPLVLFAALARADATATDPAKGVQAIIDALRGGDFSGACAKLRDAPVDVLAARPDLVFVLCDRAYRYDKQGASVDARRSIALRLFDVATAAVAAAPGDDRPKWALAESMVLRERTGRTGADAWTAASDVLEKVHAAKPTDGLALDYAVSFLLEGACDEPDATLALAEHADLLARKAMESQKDSATLAAGIATSQFWAAKTLLAGNRKVAKAELKATLDTLRPFATKANPAIETATAYNDAVAFGRANGFVLPDHFVDVTHGTLENSLKLDVPVSSKWSFQTVGAAMNGAGGYDYVTEVSAEGKRVRQALFRRYEFSQRYTFENDKNPIGGDNCKSLTAGLLAQSAANLFAPGWKADTPSRCAIPHSLEGYQFDIRGSTQTEDGSKPEPLHLKAYVLRGNRSKACFAVLLYVYGKDDELGPEMENLVSSLRENEK